MNSEDSIQKQLAERRQRLAHGASSNPSNNQPEPMNVDDPFADNRHQLEQDIVFLSSREQELQNELDTARNELATRRARLAVLRNAASNAQRSDSSAGDGEFVEPAEQPRHREANLTQEEKDHEIAVMLQRQWEREDQQVREDRRPAEAVQDVPPRRDDIRREDIPRPQPQQSHSGFSFSISRSGDGPATFSYSSGNGQPPPELASILSGAGFGRDHPFFGMREFGFPNSRMDRPDMDFGMLGSSGLLGPRPQSPFSRIGVSPFMFPSARAPFGFGGMNLDLDNMDHDQILRLQEMIGNVPRGASTREISELPTSKFHGAEAKEETTQDEDRKKCSICLEEFTEGDDIRTLPCFHIFHADEIDQWLRQNSKCPICREPIQSGQRDAEMGN